MLRLVEFWNHQLLSERSHASRYNFMQGSDCRLGSGCSVGSPFPAPANERSGISTNQIERQIPRGVTKPHQSRPRCFIIAPSFPLNNPPTPKPVPLPPPWLSSVSKWVSRVNGKRKSLSRDSQPVSSAPLLPWLRDLNQGDVWGQSRLLGTYLPSPGLGLGVGLGLGSVQGRGGWIRPQNRPLRRSQQTGTTPNGLNMWWITINHTVLR